MDSKKDRQEAREYRINLFNWIYETAETIAKSENRLDFPKQAMLDLMEKARMTIRNPVLSQKMQDILYEYDNERNAVIDRIEAHMEETGLGTISLVKLKELIDDAVKKMRIS